MKWIRAASISVLLLPLSFTTYAWADANIITVAAYGADFTNPLDAVDAITDADRSNPYIIQIAPGRYNLGASPLYLKEYVSLVGSGQKATYIVGAVDSISGPAPGDGPGVINGADNSEIRDLTVINRYPGTAHAINNYGVANSISDVTAIARGGGGSGAFKAGIWNAGGSNTTLTHVTSRAVGTGGASPCFGLYNQDSIARVHGSRLIARNCDMNLGVAATKGSRVHIDSTEIVAGGSGTADNGIAVTSESGISARTQISNSTILGAVMAGNVDGSSAPAFLGISSTSINGLITETPPDGDIRCSGVFTADYNPLTCP